MAVQKKDSRKMNAETLKKSFTDVNARTGDSYLTAAKKGAKLSGQSIGIFGTIFTLGIGGIMGLVDEDRIISLPDYNIANEANFNEHVNHVVVREGDVYHMIVQDPQNEDNWQLYTGERNAGHSIEFTMVQGRYEAYSTVNRILALVNNDQEERDNGLYIPLEYLQIKDISGHYLEEGQINRLVGDFTIQPDPDFSGIAATIFEARSDIEQNITSYGYSVSPDIVDDPQADIEEIAALVGALAGFTAGATILGGAAGGLGGLGGEAALRALTRPRRKEKNAPIAKP